MGSVDSCKTWKTKKEGKPFFFCPFNVYNYNHNLAESLKITIKSVFKKQ